MGTIGLLCVMIENQLLTVDDALKALDRMKSGKRRLPWPEAEKMLNALRLSIAEHRQATAAGQWL